jgi:hypothetical protein
MQPKSYRPITTKPPGNYTVAITQAGPRRPKGGFTPNDGKLPAAKPLQAWITSPPLDYTGNVQYVPPTS